MTELASREDESAQLLARTLSDIASALTGQAPGMTVQSTRNYILHGGAAPAGDEYLNRWRNWAEQASDAILKYAEDCGGITIRDGVVMLGDVTLAPLVVYRDSRVCWYQSVGKGGRVEFISAISAEQADFFDDDATISSVAPYLESQKAPAQDELDGLHRAFIRDTIGFASPGTGPVGHTLEGHTLRIRWILKSSAGDIDRTDDFKVMPDNQWVWNNGNTWVGYSIFLTQISNWGVVIERLKSRTLTLLENEAEATAGFTAGAPALIIPSEIATTFQASDEAGIKVEGPGQTGLSAFVDDAAVSVAGLPQIFFLSGEAGIGKTHALLNCTMDRHDELESAMPNSGRQLPLYLYVSCSGTGLRSIKDLINAAVVDTQNLNYDSVLALCRNGLLVIVVDGFDELVGGAGYSDAHEILRPTLEKLGDRGAMMVAARSSYLANQYQSSLERAQVRVGKSAIHTLLEINRWSRADVQRLFEANPHWSGLRERLSENDLELLGVPFFSKVFHSYAAETGALATGRVDLRQILIDGYLQRERSKLASTPGQGSETLSVAQLQSVYREIAGEMFEANVQTLDRETFVLACSAGLEMDLTERRYQPMSDRLSVLCGISSEASSESSIQFAFEHDLFFETFLAQYLVSTYMLAEAKLGHFLDHLSQTMLGDTTVETLVDLELQAVLSVLGYSGNLSTNEDELLVQNLSSLAERAVAQATTEDLPALQDLSLRGLTLNDDLVGDVWLSNCSIGRLETTSVAHVALNNCHVSQLVIRSSNADLQRLRVDVRTRIDEVYDGRPDGNSRLVTSQVDVWEMLAGLGLDGADERLDAIRKDRSRTPLEDFAESTLTRFASLARPVYVVEASRRVPGDGASKWMRDPSNPCWADFTDALVGCGLATERGLNASGPAKLWVSFTVQPEKVLDRGSSDAVIDFWNRMG
ncbi:NACHT domain-containing NTPase [Nocardioides sp. cx-173]|uniref:NACHT domain-containing protein n=1 Tax=Nocardioides sp. cx-173 TaxID=2898796 RepID=UPI001E54A854|nr:NACHT domain-containing protein [Nocardioides sp. cx-173]MCD4525467.1 NACHT domain-containing protein [Nocardioides sp. cx-173]UGB42613.1 NACHT domain-containing protein [Nocardioides sp. cx-173]